MRSTDAAGPRRAEPGRAEQIQELFLTWSGRRDRAARDALITHHMPLARRLAARYRSSHDGNEDLVQVAMVGLIGAVDRFDPERATSFASFAIPTILGELKRHFRNTAWAAARPAPRAGTVTARRAGIPRAHDPVGAGADRLRAGPVHRARHRDGDRGPRGGGSASRHVTRRAGGPGGGR